jgi:hypothetical protein
MARGWGRNEEDLGADKESAHDESRAPSGARRADSERILRERALEMALARIEEQLRTATNPARRRALEAAREELLTRRGST